jgi:hypothetical protein
MLKKRAKTFIYELEAELGVHDSTNDEEQTDFLNEPAITNINLINDSKFLDEFLQNKKHIQEKIDADEEKTYSHSCSIECNSNFVFENHVFFRLSVLFQKFAQIRYDWCDTIIARDAEFNCFKITQLNMEPNDQKPIISKIHILIKSLDASELEICKINMLNLIDHLFSYYPGLHFNLIF